MTKHRKTVKAICAVTLAMMLAVLLCPGYRFAYAAGNVTVSVAGDGVAAGFPGFRMELYKVGVYNNKDYALDAQFADMGVSIPSSGIYDKSQENGGQEWFEQWMQSAASLANHISHPADGETAPQPVKVFDGVKPGDPISFSADNNVLYLLMGKTVRYDNMLYTPLPMYLCSINGAEVDALIKMTMEPVVFEHSLMKVWDDEDDKAGARPAVIEVGIFYGSLLVDRVTLGGESGEWTYSWSSEESGDTYCYIGKKDGKEYRIEFKPGDSGAGWSVREFTKASQIHDAEAKAEADKLVYYKPQYEKNSSDSLETFKITNPYEKPKTPPTPPDTEIDTGDTTNPLLWIAVAAAAALALIIVLVRRKRERDDR